MEAFRDLVDVDSLLCRFTFLAELDGAWVADHGPVAETLRARDVDVAEEVALAEPCREVRQSDGLLHGKPAELSYSPMPDNEVRLWGILLQLLQESLTADGGVACDPDVGPWDLDGSKIDAHDTGDFLDPPISQRIRLG